MNILKNSFAYILFLHSLMIRDFKNTLLFISTYNAFISTLPSILSLPIPPNPSLTSLPISCFLSHYPSLCLTPLLIPTEFI